MITLSAGGADPLAELARITGVPLAGLQDGAG